MIDPLERWREYGEKPDYAGLLTFAGMPYTEDPAELEGVDVAIVGAPMDDLVSDRPGARFAPRAIRAASWPPGPHLEAGVDAFAELSVADFGDAPVIPADPERSHAAIEGTVGQVLEAGAMPIVLGGDHSIAEPRRPRVRARARAGRAWSTSTPTRTPARRCSASSSPTARRSTAWSSRATSSRSATSRSACAATGPARRVRLAARPGITSFFMHDVRELGIREVVHRTIERVGPAGS